MARILVVDDEELVREAVRLALEEDGHEVCEAPDGVAGIASYRSEPADLVVIDLIMPGKDGIETIRDLRREFPEIKILAVSGRGGVQINANLERAKRVGADLTLPKPFDPDTIREAVRSLAPGKQKSPS